MSLDAVMSALARLATYLLPIVGVVALVYLILLFKRLMNTLKDVSDTLTIAQHEISKLEGPLNTVEDLSKTADEIHHSAKKAAFSAAKSISANADNVKTWITDLKESIPKSTPRNNIETED